MPETVAQWLGTICSAFWVISMVGMTVYLWRRKREPPPHYTFTARGKPYREIGPREVRAMRRGKK